MCGSNEGPSNPVSNRGQKNGLNNNMIEDQLKSDSLERPHGGSSGRPKEASHNRSIRAMTAGIREAASHNQDGSSADKHGGLNGGLDGRTAGGSKELFP